ncbi:cell wall hydrolase [Methylopila sp. 73B]|uniref:cell wall hydrolase n=1 Tax=Methylopila sp. 73B TaxID=1120792 RepID=UPI000379E27A|nr:cell wall hydrolase [Methylopila sp. 73B]
MTKRAFRAGVVAAAAFGAVGCAQHPKPQIVKVSLNGGERDCLARAMYFESHRGSDEGMLAVGTVVQNRLKSGKYGASYCDVVGQKGQFAPGVMTRSMDDSGAERARRVAEQVAAGKRHPGVRGAMFFHTAGLRFPYPNMRYVLVAGGNAFYEKRSVDSIAQARENARSRSLALAYAKADPTAEAKPIVVAALISRDEPAETPARVETAARPEAPIRVETHVVRAAAPARTEIAAAPAFPAFDPPPAFAPTPAAAAAAFAEPVAAR